MEDQEDSAPSKEELRLCEELRVAFAEQLAERKKKGTLHGCFFGDYGLTRVLRGNDGDFQRSKDWFERFLAKMTEYGADELIQEMAWKLEASGSQFGDVSMLPFYDEITKYIKTIFTAPKQSPKGDVIWYVPMVDNDRWSLMAEVEWGHYVRFSRASLLLRCLELERLSRKQKRLARVVLLVDLADCSLDTLSCSAFDGPNGEDINKFGECLCAHIIRRTVIVNAPQVVDMLGGLGRALLPSKFKDKLGFAKGDGTRDPAFMAEVGGADQLKKLYATREGLLDRSKHLQKALTTDMQDNLPSEEELKLVGQLRERFSEEFSRREAEGRLHRCFFGDLALTRVLRGNQGSLQQAAEWMARSLTKMAECDVDGLVAELKPKIEASPTGLGSTDMLPFCEEVSQFAHFEYSAPKLTPKGDVVQYIPVCDYDRWAMMEELEWDKWVRFARASIVLRCLELDRLSAEQNRMAKSVLLVDIANCSMDSLSCKSFDHANDRDVSKFGEAVAANVNGRIIVVNPSWAISTFYSLVSMFIPRRVLNKLHFQRGNCLTDTDFAESMGGQEQLERLFASRKNLVASSGYAARAFTSDQDDRLPTEREKKHIATMRETFKDEIARREAAGTLHSCCFSDMAMARVLRGNNGDLTDATGWFTRFLQKMVEYDADNLVLRIQKTFEASGSEIGTLSMCDHYDEVKEHFKCIFTAPLRTPKGDVVWYMPFSDVDREALTAKVNPVHLVLFLRSMFVLRALEVDRLSQAQGRMVKVYAVLDMEGSGIGSTGMPASPAFDALHGAHVWPFLQEIFAELLAPSYVLNAPWIMVKSYNWFKALIPEKLSRKLHMLDGNGMYDEAFVQLVGGEGQLQYMLASRVGLVEGITDASEGENTIAAGDVFEKRRDVRPGQVVHWKFRVLAGYVDSWFGTSDIDFSVSAFWFPEFGEAGAPPPQQLDSLNLGEEVREEESFSTDSGEVTGSFHVQRAGVVLLRWSNAHSVLRSKSVSYSIHIDDAPSADSGKEPAAAEPPQAS